MKPVLFVGVAALVATLLGGLFALRFKDKLHLILGFSAGAVIAVAFFDLLPEAIALANKDHDVSVVTSLAALGFMMYMMLDRVVVLHQGGNEGMGGPRVRGRLGAGSLAIHSVIDGMAIGLAFQVSTSVGVVVAIAVLVHDFSDGIRYSKSCFEELGDGTGGTSVAFGRRCGSIVGVSSTLLFTLPESFLGLVLALFCGFFLYIGASDLLPESYHSHPTALTTAMTLLGVAVLYAAIKLVRI